MAFFGKDVTPRINGANSRCLARITGKTPHQEASEKTQTYNVVMGIKGRKLQWLGHILRMEKDKKGKVQSAIGKCHQIPDSD